MANDISLAELPTELKLINERLKERDVASQQLQREIANTNEKLYFTLKRLLGATQIAKRRVVSDVDMEGEEVEVWSRIPSNIKVCPLCKTEVDMLPPTLKLEAPPSDICAKHKDANGNDIEVRMVWRDWFPPLNEIGVNQVSSVVMGKISDLVQLSYAPTDLKPEEISESSISFAENVMKSIYDNDEWQQTPQAFTSDAFCFTIEDVIITNVEYATYRAQGKLVNKLLERTEVKEELHREQAMDQGRKGTLGKIGDWIHGG